MKYKILIFGTGSSAEKFIANIDFDKVDILGFIDNDHKKQNTKFMGIKITSPNEIKKFDFDNIIIASQFVDEIIPQLLNLGVPFNKIIPTNFEHFCQSLKEEYKKRIDLMSRRRTFNSGKIKIGLINYNYSNYNGYALYKYMPEWISDKYSVDLIEEKDIEKLGDYDVICSSHFDGLYNGKCINIEMWHGFPIKQMGFIHKATVNERYKINHNIRSMNIDLIISYSQLYNTFFNSCFPMDPDKYRITGMPRNDLLFERDSKEKLEKICNRKLNGDKKIFYLPTWRKAKNGIVESNREWGTIFGFQNETEEEIIKLVERNKLYFFIKLHPFEYNKFKSSNIFNHERIILLTDEMLIKYKIHLYELFGCADVLITDYSSVFFDTLLIDLPIIFVPVDQKEYGENRGFLLEPYSMFTPGPNVYSLYELEKELTNYLSGIDKYKERRKQVKEVVFKYNDNKSSLRVWKEIDEYLSKIQLN